ncbi:uncharacterized protein LOC125242187 [Leguminivora glycinivorella]|uniref:uncharacterized protein LOC125242187 n=1 Tax=Leguminivora glycinivorella TaxID=1035111 RepID=UPI00200DD914|nr:uncharacterized protein LOC125242187 [Leguminivora glycinivorella]
MDTDLLNVLTYNVRTLMQEERLIELEHALKDIKWDVIGLSEVRREGEQTVERIDNVFYHFGTAGGLYGVGFLVHKKWKSNIIEFTGYSERIAVLKFLIDKKHTLTIIQVYAPTSSHSDDEVERFYDLLNKACEENRGTWNIVLGDFNAKVGIRAELDNCDVIGPHGLGIRNERDDIVLFSHTAPHLQQMLQDLSTASLEVGLTMNMAKTKLMTNRGKDTVTVDGQDIQYVDEYIYLGQIASFENRQCKEIDRRIENAWKSFWSMKTLMKGNLPLTLKRKLVDMCILPILTYGAQTWSLTEAQKSRLKICQRAMERSILGVRRTDRVRNTELRSKTGIVDNVYILG